MNSDITEENVASAFVCFMAEESRRSWPVIYESLKHLREDKFVVEDETIASFNLFLAAIALSLQGVKNLFPPEQANRIRKWVFIDMKKLQDPWAIEEVKQYEATFVEGLTIRYPLEDPLGNITGRLLHRLLGKNIRNCEGEIGDGKKSGYIGALLMMQTLSALVGLAVTWSWKNVKNCNLIATDFPPNEL